MLYVTVDVVCAVLLMLYVTVVEPYDLLSWIAILVGAVHLMGVLILCFDYWSPAKRDRYSHWKGSS